MAHMDLVEKVSAFMRVHEIVSKLLLHSLAATGDGLTFKIRAGLSPVTECWEKCASDRDPLLPTPDNWEGT
jgi:hypothetical protein